MEYRIPLDLTDREFTLRARIDRLVRPSHQGKTAYTPTEIKLRTKPEDADWVQLDRYVWLLSPLQDTTPPAEFWLEHGYLAALARVCTYHARMCNPWRKCGG